MLLMNKIVRLVCITVCLLSPPLTDIGWRRFVIVALSGPFLYLSHLVLQEFSGFWLWHFQMSRLLRLWHLLPSVKSLFKCAYAAIHWRRLRLVCWCAGWSAPLIFAYGINRFSHVVALVVVVVILLLFYYHCYYYFVVSRFVTLPLDYRGGLRSLSGWRVSNYFLFYRVMIFTEQSGNRRDCLKR